MLYLTLWVGTGDSPSVMLEIAEALTGSLPDGRSLSIEGATHDIVPAVLGPVLERFFLSSRENSDRL